MNSKPWIGTWNLISCYNESASGIIEHYYGERPFGRLIYQPSGHMSVLLARPERIPFQSSDRADARAEEKLAAFEGFDAYCGTYRFHEERGVVEHVVEGSFFPNWINTTLVRHFLLDGDRLEIRTPQVTWRGDQWVFTLLWERIAGVSG